MKYTTNNATNGTVEGGGGHYTGGVTGNDKRCYLHSNGRRTRTSITLAKGSIKLKP